MNPYGVGYTGETLKDHTATCDCCEMEFTFRAPANRGGERVRCDHCAGHQPRVTMSEQLSARREHQRRYPAIVATARRIAREAKADQKRAEDNLRESRRKVAEGLRSRNRHQAIHEAVLALHLPVENGRCLCGESYPCPLRKLPMKLAAASGTLRSSRPGPDGVRSLIGERE